MPFIEEIAGSPEHVSAFQIRDPHRLTYSIHDIRWIDRTVLRILGARIGLTEFLAASDTAADREHAHARCPMIASISDIPTERASSTFGMRM